MPCPICDSRRSNPPKSKLLSFFAHATMQASGSHVRQNPHKTAFSPSDLCEVGVSLEVQMYLGSFKHDLPCFEG